MFEKLLIPLKTYLTEADIAQIQKAYEFSQTAHQNQFRDSGDAFFTHCVAVAQLLTDLKLDAETIVAALLHDVLEDTKTSHDVIAKEFGKDVLLIVEGVTKIDSYHFPDPVKAQAENWRKMLFAITKDIRVIMVKLADRLHNMRTINYLSEEKQLLIADESINLYAPFAHRLGIHKWKNELEDLSFAVLQPAKYAQIKELMILRKEADIKNLELWRNEILQKISPSQIPFTLTARPKNIYGIYEKMNRQSKNFDDIKDLIGLRLITDTVANCYGLLGLVQAHFKPVTGSFNDYIANPKGNMYQSLHISVQGPNDSEAELQIRTEEMHNRDEYGIAAHWRYKEKSKDGALLDSVYIEEKLDWLKQIMEWQLELKDPHEFMSTLKLECTFEQVFVFSPKGMVVKLPMGATPLDFAYGVHSEIGDHCYGVKVGLKLVPLSYKLKSGDICEILTRKNNTPSPGWLDLAVTARAKSKIRKYLRENKKI